MHRTFNVSIPPSCTGPLIDQLQAMPDVIGLSVERGTSLKPAGDVLILQVLNRGTDDVLQCIATRCQGQPFSIATSELASLIDPSNHYRIEKDYDEAIWEEMEAGLRHNGRLTPNYIALMGIGGMIAAVGLVSEPAPQAVSFVAAAVLAPGFDPLAKVSLGITNRRAHLVLYGIRNSLLGYLTLIIVAGLSFWLMQLTGATTVHEFTSNPEIESLSNPGTKQYMLSLGGALAGAIIVASYRDSFIAGAMMALASIHSAAMIGVSIAASDWGNAWQGTERFGVDVLVVLISCYAVFGLKQRFVHRRQPIV
ncbi:DUF389 domain-containing protein [Fibrella forsythiae]|uniref:DUF389 domain-containing protein n=1 Tax=Fibrella forsythiae TaxID=2817061 RepID=A0ABS3JQY1_9BACT|nr:DUF389 domain-containing protein [Fibrella forsythiae]MBO0952403.1 DUF389 domain-containing protein [Fibrella forsythiae]